MYGFAFENDYNLRLLLVRRLAVIFITWVKLVMLKESRCFP